MSNPVKNILHHYWHTGFSSVSNRTNIVWIFALPLSPKTQHISPSQKSNAQPTTQQQWTKYHWVCIKHCTLKEWECVWGLVDVWASGDCACHVYKSNSPYYTLLWYDSPVQLWVFPTYLKHTNPCDGPPWLRCESDMSRSDMIWHKCEKMIFPKKWIFQKNDISKNMDFKKKWISKIWISKKMNISKIWISKKMNISIFQKNEIWISQVNHQWADFGNTENDRMVPQKRYNSAPKVILWFGERVRSRIVLS